MGPLLLKRNWDGYYVDQPHLQLQGQSSSVLSLTHFRVDVLSQDVSALYRKPKSFWELESFGVPDSDCSVYDKFQETVKFKDGDMSLLPLERVASKFVRQLPIEHEPFKWAPSAFEAR